MAPCVGQVQNSKLAENKKGIGGKWGLGDE